jgi:hypothetical protein
MTKQSKTKVNKELSKTAMISVQSRVSRLLVIESIDLAESQYQTWSHFVEIGRVTKWLPC